MPETAPMWPWLALAFALAAACVVSAATTDRELSAWTVEVADVR